MSSPRFSLDDMSTREAPENWISGVLQESASLYTEISKEQIRRIAQVGQSMIEAIRQGHKIIWFGNGGSATQSQHMAAEFVGRFERERSPLPSISLTENVASVTAIGNDYAFEQIFSRQLEALAQVGDIAIGLSTSGNSRNVLEALRVAKRLKIMTVGLSGQSGGQMASLCNVCICVPSLVTARIQEVHLTIGHILCALVEDALRIGKGK